MLFRIVRTIVLTICCTLCSASTIHTLQTQRYQLSALKDQMRRRNSRLLAPDILIAVITALIDWYLPILMSLVFPQQAQRESMCAWIMLGVFAAVSVVSFLNRRKLPQAKPFSWTRRMLRLIIVTTLINLAGIVLLGMISISPYLMFAAIEYTVFLAALIMRPIEDRINVTYYKSAREKLIAHKGLIRIGITGSYGKTQVKMILKGILSEKYRVLATPPSFSTAMGISRVINEQLKPAHQVFIAEMGAQHRGEIREMAKLVRPQYGVLTTIGRAHINTFGSIENIAQAKYELIEGLPAKGCAFFGVDEGYCDRLYALYKGEKYRAGTETEAECDMRADHIETGIHGTRFQLTAADGTAIWVKTRLLGAYNVQDIALAASVAHRLGMSLDAIAKGVEKLRPLSHRLELVPGDIHVIDDSDNVLMEGAAEALRVLREFPGRRIIVTQGFGEIEDGADERNYAFGMQIADCADYVVLIDPDFSQPIMHALEKRGFPRYAVRMVSDEADAAALVREKAQSGDTILYEGVYPPG